MEGGETKNVKNVINLPKNDLVCPHWAGLRAALLTGVSVLPVLRSSSAWLDLWR